MPRLRTRKPPSYRWDRIDPPDEPEEEDEDEEQEVRGRGKRPPLILRLSVVPVVPVVPEPPPSNLYCGPIENVDKLEIPPSSKDLLISDGHQLMQALSIYEILRHFGYIIRLSPFRFEDFCTSLLVDEQSNLLSEIHIQLLRTCIREDKQQQTWIVPAELRDSINVYLHLSDTFDWPAALRLYLSADETENGTILDALYTCSEYPFNVDLQTKLDVLQLLCNQFLLSSFARDDIVNGGVIKHDDMCRLCHKVGELVPCDSCSAAYHPHCTDPPVTAEEAALEKPWNCPVCQTHRVKGVTDCIDPIEKSGYLKRHDMLGWDRHGRRYWFLSRRVFVVDENEEDVRYYSTRKQFEELLSQIDGDHHEKYLSENLTELKQHILSQLEITEDLYNSLRAWRKSYIDLAHQELEHRTNKTKGLANGNNLCVKNEEDDVDMKPLPEGEKPDLDTVQIKIENSEDIVMNGDDSCDDRKSSVMNENDNTCSSMVSTKPESEVGTITSNHIKSEHDPTLMSDDDSRSQDTTTIDDPLSFAQNGVLLDSCNTKRVANSVANSRNISGVSMANDSPNTMTTRHATRFSTSSTPNTGHRDDYTLVQDAQTGMIAKISKKSLVLDDLKSDTYLYKLGLEGTYKNYQNQFTLNALALNKHQHSDNDPNRSLGNKFSINSGNAFKWYGPVTGSRNIMPATIRTTLLKFESLLPQAFMHPNWSYNRSKWIRTVNTCMRELDFANALSILESCIKPVLFRIAWIDNLGTLSLHKTTFLEREELKKTDRQPRGFERREYLSGDFELSIRLGTAVKFSSKLKPVKHKVWKQKGEEYRLTGLNGWSWLSSTFRSRPTDKPKSYQNTSFKYLEPIHSDPSLGNNVQEIIKQTDVIDISENLKAEDSKRFLYTKKPIQFNKLKKIEELYKVVESQGHADKINSNQNQNINNTTTKPGIHSSTRSPPRLMKGRLPKCHDFLTHKGKLRSLLVLPEEDLSQLARAGGLRETRGFSYNAKQNNYVWPYGITPRPVFRTCWLYKNRIIASLHEVAIQLRILYACIRWEDLQARPPASGNNVIVTDNETVTIELLKRRDKPPHFIRTDYLIRKTVVPIEQPTKYRKAVKLTPSARSGLRARRRQDEEEERNPTTTEVWVPEEHLELWELKQFDEKMERINQLAKEKANREEAERKRLSEEQARRARLAAAQQKRNPILTQQPIQMGPRILPTTPIIHRTTPIIVNRSMKPLFITFRPSTPTSTARTFIINMPRNATTITLPPNMRLATTTGLTTNVINSPTTAILTPTAAIPASTIGITTTPTITIPTPKIALPTPTVAAPSPTITIPTPTIALPTPTISTPTPTIVAPSPTIAVPTSTIATPTPTIAAFSPTIALPNPTIAAPNPTNAIPSPASAIPPPTSAIPLLTISPQTTIEVPSDSIPDDYEEVPTAILEEPSTTIEIETSTEVTTAKQTTESQP